MNDLTSVRSPLAASWASARGEGLRLLLKNDCAVINLETEKRLTSRIELMGCLYLQTIAMAAGFDCQSPLQDQDGIDYSVQSQSGYRPRIDFQVKCTTTISSRTGDHFSFRLKRKHYDKLRLRVIQPRFLLVVLIPDRPDKWLTQSQRRLGLRSCGFWRSLAGEPAAPGETISVRVSYDQVLTPESIHSLMTSAAL